LNGEEACGGDPLRDRVPIGQRRFERLHQQVAIEAQDLVEQLDAEAIHHRHDDDQVRDPERDAEEREQRDDGDESFLAPRQQVSQRQHPFERREGPGPGGVAHKSPSSPGISPDSGGFKPSQIASETGG
jgi:hypothetical protein